MITYCKVTAVVKALFGLFLESTNERGTSEKRDCGRKSPLRAFSRKHERNEMSALEEALNILRWVLPQISGIDLILHPIKGAFLCWGQVLRGIDHIIVRVTNGTSHLHLL